jgi:thiamine transport system permease protein
MAALITGFHMGGAFGGNTASAAESSLLISTTIFTLKQSFWSALLSLVIGMPAAIFFSRCRGFRVLRSVLSVSFALPSMLVVLGFVLFWGNAGWLNQAIAVIWPGGNAPSLRVLYHQQAIILAHAFYNFPLVIALVSASLGKARRAFLAPALNLGASPVRAFVTVMLPIIVPSMLTAFLLAFLYSFTSFAIVLSLGGGPACTTLAVEIYRYARVSLNFPQASRLALLETLIELAVFGLYLFCERRSRTRAFGGDRVVEMRSGRAAAVFYGGYFVLLIVFVAGPLLSVLLESFLTRGTRFGGPRFTLRWWATLGTATLPALGRSVLLAVTSATLATGLALCAAGDGRARGRRRPRGGGQARDRGRPRGLPLLVNAPLVSSGIVLGLGFLALYGNRGARTPLALVALHAVTALPFAYHSVNTALRQIPASLREAASVFGASPLRRFATLDVPLALPGIRAAWAFSAALSLGEVNAIMMLGLEDWETLPLLMYHATAAKHYGTACAAGTL